MAAYPKGLDNQIGKSTLQTSVYRPWDQTGVCVFVRLKVHAGLLPGPWTIRRLRHVGSHEDIHASLRTFQAKNIAMLSVKCITMQSFYASWHAYECIRQTIERSLSEGSDRQ